MKSVFALVDCENFYVSCERVFDPALRKLPLVVLSNNDGCVIARSQQVKAAGVPMGAPYFQWEDELDALDAVVRSSNYALYGDMSRRVMQELEAEALEVERYSIDEAFLTLPAQSRADLEQTARRIQQRVRRRQGLPLRIAVGPTKTLAKAADEKAKANEGVFVCPPEPTLEALLRSLPVGKVWGIGRAYEQTLQEYGVDTAAGFRALPDQWIRRKMSVVGLRTAYELRGRSCLPLDLVGPDRKSLIRSRSFGTQVHDKETLREALAKHAQSGPRKSFALNSSWPEDCKSLSRPSSSETLRTTPTVPGRRSSNTRPTARPSFAPLAAF